MKDLSIYKNNIFILSETFLEDYETFYKKTGHYVINAFLIILLGKENPLSIKIMKAQNFILNKLEKDLLSSVLEKHIDSESPSFRNASDKDIYVEITYKEKKYLANSKHPEFKKEKNLVRAMSLYNKFYDPKDENVIEIRFT